MSAGSQYQFASIYHFEALVNDPKLIGSKYQRWVEHTFKFFSILDSQVEISRSIAAVFCSYFIFKYKTQENSNSDNQKILGRSDF